MATYFCQNGGNDANDGLDNIGAGLATATWTEITKTLTQAGHGYTFAAGDVIYLATGTGLVTPGLYEVTSSTANTIVLAATSSLPGVGDANDVAAGDDGTGDWATSSGPWLTIDFAMNSVVASDKVWLRSTAAFVESPAIDTAAGATTEIVFEGYATDLGDVGQITITGMLTDTIATSIMYCFKNIIFDANGANANAVQLSSYNITWRNCVFKGATGNGCSSGSVACFYECEFLDNALDGASVSSSLFLNCKFYRNGSAGIDCSSGLICYNCVFFSNGGHAIDGGAINDRALIVLNCTIDGDAKDTGDGVTSNAAFRGYTVVMNTILYDCSVGINSHYGDRDILVHNLLNSNTADYTGDSSGQEGEVTGAPNFVNEVAGADYTLDTGSPAIGAGSDYSADEMDIGAIQKASAAGGGGLLIPNKRGNKQ